MKYIARNYQSHTTEKIIVQLESGLFLDMGLGKTVSSLTAVDELIFDCLLEDFVLIIAPKNVAVNVWPDELAKWDHLKNLTYSVISGTEKQRKMALAKKARVYVIGRDNVVWLVSQYQSSWPFRFVIIDELSSFKSSDSLRFKALKLIRPYIKRIVGLTGTPASNGLMDLWAQMYLLDKGERLGKFKTNYRDRFFEYNPYKKNLPNGDILQRGWHPKEGAREKIYGLISDICISMKAEDYLDLPKVLFQDVVVRLTDKDKQLYEQFEKESVLSFPDDDDLVTAANRAALSGKLRQFANGAVYNDQNFDDETGKPEPKSWRLIHDAKLDRLEEMVEALNGEPVFIAYAFKHDAERILARLAKYGARQMKGSQDIRDWNEGKVPVLLAHPASAGHGLNLQFGGHHIIWFGVNWSLELYLQFNKRLDRPGQKFPVIIQRLLVEDTLDMEIVPVLDGKETEQNALMKAIRVRKEKYRGGEQK